MPRLYELQGDLDPTLYTLGIPEVGLPPVFVDEVQWGILVVDDDVRCFVVERFSADYRYVLTGAWNQQANEWRVAKLATLTDVDARIAFVGLDIGRDRWADQRVTELRTGLLCWDCDADTLFDYSPEDDADIHLYMTLNHELPPGFDWKKMDLGPHMHSGLQEMARAMSDGQSTYSWALNVQSGDLHGEDWVEADGLAPRVLFAGMPGTPYEHLEPIFAEGDGGEDC